MVIAPYILILVFIYVASSIMIIKSRRKELVFIGDGGHKKLSYQIRAFGNLSEYAPIMIAILIVAEVSGSPNFWLHILGVTTVIGRGMHAFSFQGIPSSKWHFRLRQTGMVLTYLMLITGGVSLLFFM